MSLMFVDRICATCEAEKLSCELTWSCVASADCESATPPVWN